VHAVVAAQSSGYLFCSVLRLRKRMDRLDAMKVFVVAVDEGSLAAAGRKLGRSPAAVSRAIAFLEERAGTKLLHRTTRSIKLSEEGERYVASCRRVLAELEEADISISGQRSLPRGTLSLTAGIFTGEMLLLPIVEAFLDAYPTVSARLMLVDRPVNLIDEGIDVALRIGNLADSSMVATRVGGCGASWSPRQAISGLIRPLRSHRIWPSTRSSRWPIFQPPGPFRRLPVLPPRERFSSRRAWYSTAYARCWFRR
jgi:DNA-binding transcriptional LysR family regulator